MEVHLKNGLVMIGSILVGILIARNFNHDSDSIELNENKWWGPGKPPKIEDNSMNEIKINISDELLLDFELRLNTARPLILPLQGVQHQYGINTELIQDILEFWKIKYKWSKRQSYFNKFKQYITEIQGLKIHYVHEKPNQKLVDANNLKIIPILLLHGWPGSIREFYDIVAWLTKPRDDKKFVFEVIVPSLPGFGFSDGASKPGLGATEMAILFNNLMKRLRIDQYYVQGGDLGAVIGAVISSRYPGTILGFHSNMCFTTAAIPNLKIIFGRLYPGLVVEEKHVDKIYPIFMNYLGFLSEIASYTHFQATKPDTIGVALSDSPIGLASYILEKFIILTNKSYVNIIDGNIRNVYSYEVLLDNIMVYWWSNSITTSMRIFAETFNPSEIALGSFSKSIKVPSACTRYKNSMFFQPESVLKTRYEKLVYLKDYDVGGHFPALELPDIFAEDLWNAVYAMEMIK